MNRSNQEVATAEKARCFHCGEYCRDGSPQHNGRHFCCLGCQSVFLILSESGLDHFYDLVSSPGTRVSETNSAARWSFLDDKGLQSQLLDFSDDTQSRITLQVPAIHCLACVWLLENLHRLAAGIQEARVNFARRELSLKFDPRSTRLSEIARLLASLGYEPSLTLAALDASREPVTRGLRRRQWLQIGIAGFGFGNLMLLALPAYLGLDSFSGPWFSRLAGVLSAVIALPVLVYSAADYWREAWLSVRRRQLVLEVPIALGLAAIYGETIFEIATQRGAGYADSLTGLIFFLLCGRMFQRRSFERIAFDRDYKGFFPLSVQRRRDDREESVAISELSVGDRLLVRHGELLPADARLVSESALLDYSFVTGESQPTLRLAGEQLYAGGRQTGGLIEVETTKPVSESYLTSLWNHEAFRKSKDFESDTLSNRYSQRFTYLVIGTACSAALFWAFIDPSISLKAFTSVLIVACPCALALVAPLSLGTAQRWFAGQKVFLRNAHVVERLGAVDTIVLDKTGTLTSSGTTSLHWWGTPLSDIEKCWICSTARHSAHPLAIGINETFSESALAPVTSFVETGGSGIKGRCGEHGINIGSATWLQSLGVRQSNGVPGLPVREEAQPASGPNAEVLKNTAHVSIDGTYRGYFAMESRLRPEVDALITELRKGYHLALLSGDNDRELKRFQALLGENSTIKFNQNPFDKLEAIGELQHAGRRVMMVGDGLNDAGALQQADVGVAVVDKVGTFSPASDVILEAARIRELPQVLALSRQTVGVVRAGFFISGLYNLIGISIAASGLLSPLVCAVLMPTSSITIALFSTGVTRWLAQRRWRASNPSAVPRMLLAEALQ